MAMRAEDPGLPVAADRLGRRLFSGLVVVALVIGGVVLVHDERHETLGTVLLVVAGLVWLADWLAADSLSPSRSPGGRRR
jgi:hypothetical protein